MWYKYVKYRVKSIIYISYFIKLLSYLFCPNHLYVCKQTYKKIEYNYIYISY